jgi:hypothetical protein
MIESLKTSLIKSVMWANSNANGEDLNRNHTNYGAATAYASVLRDFGVKVDVPVYEDGKFLRIPKVIIETRIINFENVK